MIPYRSILTILSNWQFFFKLGTRTRAVILKLSSLFFRYLTEEKEVNLNVRDKWDSTPLYYACLCGHPDVVAYLLENGARCEASTFDGERCIYGALTNQIKKMLVNYSVISSRVKRREPFQEFLRRLLEDACESSDITFIVHGVHIKVHKFILAARSTYFEQQFKGNLFKKVDGEK